MYAILQVARASSWRRQGNGILSELQQLHQRAASTSTRELQGRRSTANVSFAAVCVCLCFCVHVRVRISGSKFFAVCMLACARVRCA